MPAAGTWGRAPPNAGQRQAYIGLFSDNLTQPTTIR
jgi:hypothetical protein